MKKSKLYENIQSASASDWVGTGLASVPTVIHMSVNEFKKRFENYYTVLGISHDVPACKSIRISGSSIMHEYK